MEHELLIMLIQWGIIGFFILFHFITGFVRGTKKTLFYTIVSFLLTFLLLWGISFITIRFMFTPGSLLNFIERFATIPAEYRMYLVKPDLSAIVFAVIDVFVRIVAFIILYPLVKKLLTWILFSPLWKHVFKSKDKQHYSIKHKQDKMEFIAKKQKGKISLSSRFVGATVGAIRGLVVAFVFLLPVIMLGSIVRTIDGEDPNSTNLFVYKQRLESNNTEISNDVLEILEIVQAFDKYGLSQFTKDIKVKGKSIDQSLFDFVFTTQIVTKDSTTGLEEKLEFKLSDELNVVGQIARQLIEEGYLDDDFDYLEINYDNNYEDIDYVLSQLGRSDLINLLVPIGVDFVSNEYLPEILGFNPNHLVDSDGNTLYTKDALEALSNLNFKLETQNLSNAIKEILMFGNIEELIELKDNPKMFLEFNDDKQRQVANILRSVSELELLAGANLGVEYLIRQDAIKDKFTFTETPVEYIQERLAFILEDNNYFIGETGDIYNIASLIDAVFSEEFSDFDYTIFAPSEGSFKPESLLEEDVGKIVSSALLKVVDVNTFMNLIPLGIDYIVLETKPELIEDVSQEILDVLEDTNYTNEITNINDIYKKAVTLGLGAYFEKEADIATITDNILINNEHTDAIKVIINHIFEGSTVTNDILDIVAAPAVEKYVQDEEYKNLALEVVNSNINYGAEIVGLVELAESLYGFTTLKHLSQMKNPSNDQIIDLVASFGGLEQLEFDNFKEKLTGLQTLEIIDRGILELLRDELEISQIVIPHNLDLKKDINRSLDVVYELAMPLHNEKELGNEIKDTNLASVLNTDNLVQTLTFTPDDSDSVLLASIVGMLKGLNVELDTLGKIDIPFILIEADFSSQLWLDEINSVIEGVFDLTKAFSNSDELFPLSFNNLKNVKGLSDIPSDVINRFSDDVLLGNTFNKVLSTEILRHNVTNIIHELIDEVSNELNMSTLYLSNNIYDSNDIIKVEEILDLIHIGAQSFKLLPNEELSIQASIDLIDAEVGVNTFNIMNDELLFQIGHSNLINPLFRKSFLDTDFQSYMYDQIGKLDIPIEIKGIRSGIFEYDYALDTQGDIYEETLYELLSATNKLQIPYKLIKDTNQQNIIDFINELEVDHMKTLLEVKVVHETIDNVINLAEVYDLGNRYFDRLLNELNSRDLTLDISFDTYYAVLDKTKDTNNLFSIDEMEDLLYAVQSLSIIDIDYTKVKLKDIDMILKELQYKRVEYQTGYFNLTKPKTFRALAGLALKDDDFISSTVDIVNSKLVLDGRQLIELSAEDINFGLELFDEDGILLHEDASDLLIAVASQDLKVLETETRPSLVSFVNDLLNPGVGEDDNLNKLDHLYNSRIITKSIKAMVENDKLQDQVVQKLNNQLDKVFNRISVSPTHLKKSDLNLSYELFDLNGATKAVEAFSKMDIDSFTELKNITNLDQVGKILKLETQTDVMDAISNIPLVFHIFETMLSTDFINNTISQVIEDKLQSKFPAFSNAIVNLNFRVDENLVTKEELTQLVVSFYGSGIRSVSNLTSPDAMLPLSGAHLSGGVLTKGIEHIFESNLIYETVDRIMQSITLRDAAIAELNNQLSSRNIDYQITDREAFEIPALAIGINGKVNKEEFTYLVDGFNKLDLTSYSQLLNARKINDIGTIFNSEAVETLLQSEIVYYTLGYTPNSETARNLIAKTATRLTSDRLDIDYDFKPESFSLESYEDIFEQSGVHKGYITKEEIVKLFELAKIENEGLSLSSLTNLVDQNIVEGKDDLDRVLESKVVHSAFDRVVKSEFLGTMVGDMITEVFNKDIDYYDVSPDEDLLDLDNRFKKDEIRLMVKSLILLDIEGMPEADSVTLTTIMGLIGKNEDAGVDDLNRLLQSNYIARLTSKMLTSKTVKESLGSSTGVDANDLVFTASLDVNQKYLTQSEIYNLFVSLDVLGISDFDNMDVSTTTLKSLSDVQLDKVLESSYMYEVISEILKTQISDIPQDAIEQSGRFLGFVKKSEVKDLIEVLNILGTDDTGDIDPSSISIAKLEELVNLESVIVTRLLSTELMDMNTIEIPSRSTINDNKDIRQDELLNIIETLAIIANNDKTTIIGNIQLNNISVTTGQFGQLLDLEITDMSVSSPSPFIKRMLSNGVKQFFTDIPAGAIDDEGDVSSTELNALHEALILLNITTLDNVDNELTFAKLKAINEDDETVIDTLYDVNGSKIIYVYTSDLLIAEADTLGISIPDSYYIDDTSSSNRLKRESIKTVITLISSI